MTHYLVIYEQGPDSWGAYSPDLPGCTAVGSSRAEVEHLMRAAVEEHLGVLRSEGLPVPAPLSTGSRRRFGAAAAGRSGCSDISEWVEEIIRAESAPFH